MKIHLNSVFVEDQDKALTFYTEVLGFIKKNDFPIGEFKWLTVVSPEGPEEVELLLEPNDNPIAATYQKALFEEGITARAFEVDDIASEHARMKALGVSFTMDPTKTEGATVAIFDDTCGNLIQLYEL